jgi:hypothetical protein
VSDVKAGNNGKRTGRPPKDEKERRVSLSLRVRPDVKNALDAAARVENRSVTQLSELAIASFLDARKHGHASPSSAGKEHKHEPARLEQRSLKRRRDPIDVLGRVFGRDVTALLLLIGYLVKDVLYYEDKNIKGTWLTDPGVFERITNSIIALLQLVGPEEHAALFAGIRKCFWGENSAKRPWDQLDVACVAGAIAFYDTYNDNTGYEPWIPVIRDWLGHATVARIEQRIGSDPTEGRSQDGC